MKRRHKPDRQRGRLYKAERDIDAWKRKRDYFRSTPEAMRWVYKVCLDTWTVNRWGRESAPATLCPRDREAATGDAMVMVLPPWSHYRLVLLHEIAHSLNDWLHDWWNIQGHGPEFAGIFLELVEHFMSKRDANQLLKAYERHGIKHTASCVRTSTVAAA